MNKSLQRRLLVPCIFISAWIEINLDFLPKDNDADFFGHKTKENALLVGFDLAF